MYQSFGWKYSLTAFIVLLWGFALYVQGVPLGLDLRGGTELIYRLDMGGKAVDPKVTDDAVDVLRQRMDKLGIKELSIRKLGADKVVIQVPSATQTEIEKIKQQIEKAGKLQFKILVTDQIPNADRLANIERIKEEKELGIWKEETDRYDIAEYHPEARGGGEGQYALLYNRTPTGKEEYVDGKHLADAYRALDDKGLPAVGFTWGPIGRKLFYSLTEANVNRQLGVILDGYVRSAPVIRQAIGKRGIIEGGEKGWPDKELVALIVILKAGALPAKPVLAYSKTVGAQLGQAAVRLGGLAIIFSLIVVVIFMVVYYRVRPGLIADIALALNLFLILGTLAMFDATLTLPGIAGILLTAGMAVDANILIYERIREEIARGAALKQAIQAGYDRAFWTIFDANLTTALTAIVLMWVGTGPIKGFGLTLTIGIIVSMFTALFVTRALYGFFVVKEFITEIKFRSLFQKPTFDFYASRKKAFTLSLTLIAVGWLIFLARGTDKYGIDFTGGTVMQMRLRAPIGKTEVEKKIAEHFKSQDRSIAVEVQRMGAGTVKGGQEFSREWQLRTRMVGAGEAKTAKSEAPKKGAEKKSSSTGFTLFPKAYGQDPADPEKAPADPDKPPADPEKPPADPEKPPADPEKPPADPDKPPADPEKAPPADEEKAPPADEEKAPPAEEKAPPAEEKAPPAEKKAPPADDGTTGEKAQDFFEDQIRNAFGGLLVEPYPTIDGKPYTTEPVEGQAGRVRVHFRVNVVPIAEGIQAQVATVTAERITSELPLGLRKLAASLNIQQLANKRRKEILEAIAGKDAPGFQVNVLTDPDPTDLITPFEFVSHPLQVSQTSDKPIVEMLEVFKEALEKVQEKGVYFSPATPFPSIDQVGSAVAKNLLSKAIIATFFCVVFICLYVWLRFDLWSGIAAIVAVFHDVLALLGFLAILDLILTQAGLQFDVKFNLTTISAFLTMVGYSINDTIVVLDRIREDKRLEKAKQYTPPLVNEAINKTLMRTVLTSLTTFLVCLVLFVGSFFGLSAIQGLSVALLFGVAVGTYSSVFVAAPILLVEKRRVVIALSGVALFLLLTLIGSYVLPWAMSG